MGQLGITDNSQITLMGKAEDQKQNLQELMDKSKTVFAEDLTSK